MKSKREEMGQIVIRPPAGMRERIKAAAEANNRSMNAEIVATLEEKYPAPLTFAEIYIGLVDRLSKLPADQRGPELDRINRWLEKEHPGQRISYEAGRFRLELSGAELEEMLALFAVARNLIPPTSDKDQGFGHGDGSGYGYGDGEGDGYGDGFGDGFGAGYGFGDGDGDGYGEGAGAGNEDGSGTG